MVLKIIISIFAITLAFLHTLYPQVDIDLTSLILIIIALFPWFAHILKSMELPGGIKFEFKELQDTMYKAKEAGLISEDLTTKDDKNYSFQLIATNDPVLALAGLRIEIEKRLKKLAEGNDIGTKMQGIGSLIQNLKTKGIINNQEYSFISDMVGTLNRAVHAENIDDRAAHWAIEYGPKILKALDEKIETQKI